MEKDVLTYRPSAFTAQRHAETVGTKVHVFLLAKFCKILYMKTDSSTTSPPGNERDPGNKFDSGIKKKSKAII